MAYYVNNEGRIFTYRMASPTSIRLTHEHIGPALKRVDFEVPDPDPNGACFATIESAKAFAGYVKETSGDMSLALRLHSEWFARRGWE